MKAQYYPKERFASRLSPDSPKSSRSAHNRTRLSIEVVLFALFLFWGLGVKLSTPDVREELLEQNFGRDWRATMEGAVVTNIEKFQYMQTVITQIDEALGLTNNAARPTGRTPAGDERPRHRAPPPPHRSHDAKPAATAIIRPLA